ncbi:rhomboid family protein [Lactococcus lactis]|uniref:rhomboid family protein n=1 Tax=Lactococcus lactis TaxID=1358 RepID=UPI0027387334|nr:rhomboid family intramembrane serine protease [Lactococcus lactis]
MNFNEIKRDFTRYKATYILSIITLLVWLWQFFTYGISATSAINLFNSGAILGQVMLFDPSQMWRLFTALFIHIGWAHVLLNVATLFFIGRQIENVFGWLRFTLIYLLSGIFGNAMVFLLTPRVVSAGASTSIFGLFAAVVGLAFFTKHPFLQQIGRMFTVLIVANLVMNLFSLGNVSIWAHIGGAIGGLLLSAIFAPKAFIPSIPQQYRIFATGAFVILLVLFFGLPFFK